MSVDNSNNSKPKEASGMGNVSSNKYPPLALPSYTKSVNSHPRRVTIGVRTEQTLFVTIKNLQYEDEEGLKTIINYFKEWYQPLVPLLESGKEVLVKVGDVQKLAQRSSFFKIPKFHPGRKLDQ